MKLTNNPSRRMLGVSLMLLSVGMLSLIFEEDIRYFIRCNNPSHCLEVLVDKF